MSAGGPAYKQMAPLGGSGDVAWPGSGLWRRVGRTMFRTKSVEEALADRDDDGKSLKKCLNLYELILFGLGWMMGAGIFVLTGVAASLKAGPAIVLSYAFAGVVCVFSAFSYAEFAARIPLSGSAYTYAYTTVGEFPAWIIGWDLTLEYMIGSAAVARGWSGYVRGMLTGVGIDYPLYLTHWQVGPCDVDITAALSVVVLTIIICFGIKESSHFNGLIVGTTVFSILFIIVLGAFYADPDNWEPFTPYGVSGIFSGSALIFFAYIGFDSISAAAEECNNPQRDLPIGIMACLAIAGVLYSGVAAVITLMVKYDEIDLESPLSSAFAARGLGWAQVIISIGAFAALTSSILGGLLYLPRIYFTMARDGLMWPIFSYVHPKTHTPLPASIVTGTLATVLTLLVKIEVLADMVSIGSLFAMLMVCACVLTTRYEQPNGSITPVMMVLGLVTASAVCFMLFVRDHPYSAAIFGLLAILPIAYFFKTKQTFVPETFKCPLVPLTPILGILSNIYLMANLTAATWWRLFGWLALGLCIYLGYGIRNSRLAKRQNQYNDI